MRKLRIFEHISLDGVIQVGGSGEDGDFPYGEWTAPYRSPAGKDVILAAYGESFDLLLGRRTYDLWSDFWPKAPSSSMSDRLNAAKKYVATHRPDSLGWGPFEGLGPDIVEDVRGVKASGGPDLILSGSSTLTSVLLEHGLADEVVLIVYPVLLGKGKRFFSEGGWRLYCPRITGKTPAGGGLSCGLTCPSTATYARHVMSTIPRQQWNGRCAGAS